MKGNLTKILAFDTSLGAPGVGLVSIRKGKATVVEADHYKTNGKDPIPLRTEHVEAWATLFVAKHVRGGFDYVFREDFHGMSSHQNYPVFSAWTSVDRAVYKHDYEFDKYVYYTKKGKRKSGHGIPQARAKQLVVGKGRAEKHEVETAVRELTGFKGEFKKDDESDAVCLALAAGIQLGLLPDVHGKLNEHDIKAQGAEGAM